MDRQQQRAVFIDILKSVAPELDEGALRDEQPLRRQVDLDSMDWLNVIIGLSERLGVDIPESDYRRLGSVDAILDYLAERA